MDTEETNFHITRATNPLDPCTRWYVWAMGLVLVYLTVGAIAWERTLVPDEIWALLHAARPFSEQLESVRMDLVHPPLFYLLERGWLHLFGYTEGVAKSLVLVVNALALILFTWLATRVTRYWRLTSFLFASGYFFVDSPINLVRMYGLAVLLTVIALLLWEAVAEGTHRGKLAAWALVMILLTYTHYVGLLLLAGFVMAIAYCGQRRWVSTLAAVVPGIAILPWLLYVLPIYLSRGLQPNLDWVEKNSLRALAQLPFLFLSNAIPSGWNPFAPPGWLEVSELKTALIVLAAVLHLVLFIVAWRKLFELVHGDKVSIRRSCVAATALVIIVPVLTLYGFSITVIPAFNARFLIAILPAYWLMVGLLAEFGAGPGRALLVGTFLPWVLVSLAVTMTQPRPPSPIRQVESILMSDAHDNDLILCDGVVGYQFYWEWAQLLGRRNRIEVLPTQARAWWQPVLPQSDLEELDLNGINRVWVFHHPSNKRGAERIARFFADHGFSSNPGLLIPFLVPFERGESANSSRTVARTLSNGL